MASGTVGDSNDDLNWRASCRWTENCKVYTRKPHKKAQKASNNNDAIASTTSTAEKSVFTEVEPTSIASTSAVGVSAASTSVNPKIIAAASPHGSLAITTSLYSSKAEHDELESVEGTKDVDSYPRLRAHFPHQEQSLLVDKNAESSLQKPQEQLEHQEHAPSVEEEGHQCHNGEQEGSGCRTTEFQNLDDLQLPNNNDAQILEKCSPLYGASESLQISGASANDRGGSPLPSGENDLPNGREIPKARNDGVTPGSSQIALGNSPVNVNGVLKPATPQISAVQLPTGSEAQNDGQMMPASPQASQGNCPVNINGVVKQLVISSIGDRIRFNICKTTPKNSINDLRKNLECELVLVRKLVKQLESKELQLASFDSHISSSNLNNISNYVSAEGAHIGGFNHLQLLHARNNVVDRRLLLKVNDVGAMGHQDTRPMGLARVNSDLGAARNIEPRVYNRQLSVAVMENNNRAGDFVEKEKRTPKANQYYRNSEFLLGKDRLPPESNKRLKTSNGRKHSGETEHSMGFGFAFDKSRNQVFKNFSRLLQRLMKHKYGWVFNEPVNAKALGLVDYHDIIKHPMDLGTIKTRLSQNFYKTPREFAEDVRLVFHNAMTYNPKGQDVHFMAEQLLQIFEEKWPVIEAEYNPYWKYQMYQDGGLPTPTSRKALPQSHFAPGSVPLTASGSIPLYGSAAPQIRTSDRPERLSVDQKIHRPHVGRTPAPKKPKAKDPNKRDMTYDEKQRLSTNLQGLPAEKLDSIVQIIKKRNTALSQHDDEIEVDIDSVDPETLWELDRLVTNYKKSLSKNKRKAELALQARTLANQNVGVTNSAPPAEVQIESTTDFEKSTALADGEKRGYNRSRSSSSSSSSSDSGSSSSDSDSSSSSGDESDAAGHSPKT